MRNSLIGGLVATLVVVFGCKRGDDVQPEDWARVDAIDAKINMSVSA